MTLPAGEGNTISMIGTRPGIYLLTDFGTSDHYVAVMKAVILQRCPDAQLVDISHEVAPQAVEQGCYLLESAWPWLPEGSVVLAVVDPGVGSAREPAVFFHEGKWLVGPNNGLFGFLPGAAEGRVLDRSDFWLDEISSTFHGRDIFAPCAAYVAAGGHWSKLGSKLTRPIRVEGAREACVTGDGTMLARIIHIDYFGNAITNLRQTGASFSAERVRLQSGHEVLIARTYADVPDRQPVAYMGSTGRLEIAVRNGNAATEFNLSVGDVVSMESSPGLD